jgi:hypothetical protein
VSPDAGTSHRSRGFLLAAIGIALAWAAMLSYFLVITPWLPDLRDSGRPSVALGALGTAVAALGAARGWRARRRVLATLAFGAAALPSALLALYIFFLSYQLPATGGVIALGARLPDLQLKDAGGQERPLAGADGKKRVVLFFRGHW